MGKLIVFLVLLAAAVGAVWYAAGRLPGPTISIIQPAQRIGQTGELGVRIETPRGQLTQLDIALEQSDKRFPVFSLPGGDASRLVREGDGRVRFVGPIGKRAIPELEAGDARIVVTAVRPVLFGYRQVQSIATREVEVRLTPPTVGVVSTFHYINRGGSEMLVYQVSSAEAVSGVRVGDSEYPGFPASGAHILNAAPGLRIAFFALQWDQDINTPISLYARDDVGNESHSAFDYRIFPKTFRQSRLELDDRFLSKVVPPILQNSPELKVENPSDLLGSFLRINGELRRENSATIAALARSTAPEILWQGPFKQLVNTAVEGGFADQRTYLYKGQVVDHQVHLGFDLASTANAAVQAANRGRVVHAGWLGIYGNCVILDHGMGVQSLYGHLSSIEVKVGELVNRGDQIGRSGSTGLAGGDHLHFTMLLGGHAVTPIDWWSPKWVQDRILRKVQDAQKLFESAAPVQTGRH